MQSYPLQLLEKPHLFMTTWLLDNIQLWHTCSAEARLSFAMSKVAVELETNHWTLWTDVTTEGGDLEKEILGGITHHWKQDLLHL